MRIVCDDIEDFIENMKGLTIYRKTVYVSRISRPIEGSPSRDIILQASTILEVGKDEQALLEYGLRMGTDRPSENEYHGSEERDAHLKILQDYCELNEYTIKPGILDF